MKQQISFERLLMLYVPWGLAWLLRDEPVASYTIAWLGSFVIFFMTLSGWVKPLPSDLSFGEQLMRPIILVQIIFAGYMCCTSIFYFLSQLGYSNFSKTAYYFINQDILANTAKCQRMYCIGHAAFVTGIVLTMRYPEKSRYIFDKKGVTNLLFYCAVITLPLSIMFDNIPGLGQFSTQLSSLSFISGTLALAFAIPEKKLWNTVICLLIYFSNLYNALLSGYKEPIILSLMVLGIFLYPIYKKIILITFVPGILTIFFLLPTYAAIFRDNAWSGGTSGSQASRLAINAALNDKNIDVNGTNWQFFVNRFSEIDMFTKFVASTPTTVDYYGLTILKQSAIAIVPRIFWRSKPITEDLVMERVYTAGVVYRGAQVSAKPAFIVDGYLSYGRTGVLVSLLLYGIIAQYLSQKAEDMFGGYLLGTALIYSGLYQILWRGLSFEFLINTLFWSYVTMLIIHRIFISLNVLQRR